LGPIRESMPMARATSSTSAPVSSQRAETELIEIPKTAILQSGQRVQPETAQTMILKITDPQLRPLAKRHCRNAKASRSGGRRTAEAHEVQMKERLRPSVGSRRS
jgi:hypothetical protein